VLVHLGSLDSRLHLALRSFIFGDFLSKLHFFLPNVKSGVLLAETLASRSGSSIRDVAKNNEFFLTFGLLICGSNIFAHGCSFQYPDDLTFFG
jgi:hypothetical protein